MIHAWLSLDFLNKFLYNFACYEFIHELRETDMGREKSTKKKEEAGLTRAGYFFGKNERG